MRSLLWSNPEVTSSAADHHLEREEFAEAIELTERCGRDGECSLYAELTRGRALLSREAPPDPRDAELRPASAPGLRLALEALARAAALAEERNQGLLAIQALLYQLDAVHLLGDDHALEGILEEGLRLSRKHPECKARFLLARAQQRTREGDHKRAFADAELAAQFAPFLTTAKLVVEFCRWNHDQGSGRELARRTVTKLLPELSGPLLDQGLGLVVTANLSAKEWDKALDAVSVAEQHGLSPALAAAYRMATAWRQGDQGRVAEELEAALSKLSNEEAPANRLTVAEVFAQCGRFAEAVEVLRPAASKAALTPATKLLLHAAAKAKLEHISLEWFGALREAGVRDRRMLHSEFALLERYDVEKALSCVEALIAEGSEDRTLWVMRCHVGHILRREAAMSLTPDHVPPVDEVGAEMVNAIVSFLGGGGFHAEAMEYAYRAAHHFPDHADVNMAVVRSVMLSDGTLELGSPEEVTTACAVELSEADGHPQWLAVDDSVPLAFPDCRRSTDPLVSRILGRRVGETVIVSRGNVGDRAVTIKSLKHRHLHRLHDIMGQWHLRFPDNGLLEQFSISADPVSGALDLSPLLRMLSAVRRNIEALDNMYKSGLVSTGLLADRAGRTVFQVMGHLAHEEDLFVNCGHVDAAVFEGALARLEQCQGLAIDATAVGTLRLLELEHVLGELPCALGYSVLLSHQIASETERPLGKRESVGTLTSDGQRLAIVSLSPEDEQARRRRWLELKATLQEKGSTLPATALSSIEPERREGLIQLVGDEAAQAAAASACPGYLYWTDDAVNAFLSKEYLSADRVWTQVVLAWLQKRDIITLDAYQRASALLIAFGFGGTFTDADILIESARMGDWNPGAAILRRNLASMARADAPRSCLQRSLRYCLAVCHDVALAETRSHLLIGLLGALKLRPDYRPLLRALRDQLLGELHFHPFRAAEMQKVFEVWMRTNLAR